MLSPGEILREERIKRGYTLKDISNETKISCAFLEAIENNKLELLPKGFFVKNFIKVYARYLGLDEEEILKKFNILKEEPPKEKIEERKPGDSTVKLLKISLFLLPVLFLIIFALFIGEKKQYQKKELYQISSFSPQKNEASKESEPEEPQKIKITLKAIEDAWVDAELEGKRVLYRILKKGEEVNFECKEIIFNVIGKPEGIKIFINNSEGIPLGEPGKVVRGVKIDLSNFRVFIKK